MLLSDVRCKRKHLILNRYYLAIQATASSISRAAATNQTATPKKPSLPDGVTLSSSSLPGNAKHITSIRKQRQQLAQNITGLYVLCDLFLLRYVLNIY